MRLGLAGTVARASIRSPLTPLIVLASLLLGVLSVVRTPREEEPQIVVPMLDVFVSMPGASATEVEQRATIPVEKLLREIPGVEYVYSMSQPGGTLVIVRFYVGIKEEDAIVRTYNKMYSNFDRIAPGVSQPLIKVRSIDDVPVLALTLRGKGYDGFALRRIAAELQQAVTRVDDVSETTLLGGQRRQLRVTLDPQRLAAFRIGPSAIVRAFQVSNQRRAVGSFAQGNQEIRVEAGRFIGGVEDARRLVVAVADGRPVYLGDVAEVSDGPEEPSSYVFYGTGGAAEGPGVVDAPAVTMTVAKRKGTNATVVVRRVLEQVESMRGHILPHDVQIDVTRDYGETAQHKSDELLKHLLIATLGVTLLVALALGWRESGVVLLAVPVTLSLTLAIFYLAGYTLNRVTLFALIFSIGILVDDAIVVVENIVRHFRLPENLGRARMDVAVEAVAEVGNPTILATFAVIAAILPMAFVSGLTGPYMRPIPVGASAAMLFSLIIAFVVSPWAAMRLPESNGAAAHAEGEAEGWTTRLYRRMMSLLIRSARWRWGFLGAVAGLFLLAALLVSLKAVRVKMLPFDNKSEFQVVIDMPEGTPLERTLAAAQEIGGYLGRHPEVTDYQIYAGTSGPYNFNGLIRHYFLRRGPNQADIQVNLRDAAERSRQSHDIAKEMRGPIQQIGRRWGSRVKVSEVPPGPPVLSTLVAEVYGPEYGRQIEVARQIRTLFEQTPGVVDVDWFVSDPQKKLDFAVEQDEAALRGIAAAEVSESLAIALGGAEVGLMHEPGYREDVPIQVRLARPSRSSAAALRGLFLQSSNGGMVPLGELVQVKETTIDTTIHRKNLRQVVYVIGNVAGEDESPVYAIQALGKKIDALRLAEGYGVEQFSATPPPDARKVAMKWDGEWHITYEVFRDLGIAFAAVLVLIYVLVVGWFRSFRTPLSIMLPIPLTLIGILPAHWAMGAFFTATSMIGFIAGAGIVVRNSILLVDFIQLRRAQGMPLEQAVVDAGAVRFRPMLLTAAAVVVGASVILFDPIFQGLAISLMAGEVASTVISRVAVPVLYYLSER
ncbi:MAG TPA: efflux RND transporter permease subunit [Candidatus Polarisedimenticolaceae bacterium]